MFDFNIQLVHIFNECSFDSDYWGYDNFLSYAGGIILTKDLKFNYASYRSFRWYSSMNQSNILIANFLHEIKFVDNNVSYYSNQNYGWQANNTQTKYFYYGIG